MPLLRNALLPDGYRLRADLIGSGWRPDRLRSAMAAEGLALVRRRWVMTSDADPALRIAAALGGRVACVSAARVLGLWVPPHDALPHLALPRHSSSPTDGIHAHRRIPTGRPDPRRLLDPLEDVLETVSVCLPAESARAVWESALARDMTTVSHLRSVAWRGPRARELSYQVHALSHSGLESLGVERFARAGITMRQQVRIAGHDVDGVIGSHLLLQFDEFEHHRAAERRRDLAHDRRLQLRGYTVLRFDYHDVMNRWPEVLRQVRAAMAQGLHLPPPRR